MKIFTILASWLLILVLGYVMWLLLSMKKPIVNVPGKDDVPFAESYVSRLKTPTNVALIGWIDRLGANENCPATGKIDSNGEKSYGRFCYQAGTFKMFVKHFDLLPNAEDKEIMNMIGDTAFQKYLTILVFEENRGNWVHWRNTVVDKIGLPPSTT